MSRTNVIVLISAVVLMVFVLELVRRRKLREEYSWLWLLASTFYLLTALFPLFSRLIGGIIGTSNPATAFAFLGMQFLMLILIQYSVRLSQLTTQVKDLAQQLAILESEQKDLGIKLIEEDADKEEILEENKQLTHRIEILSNDMGNLSNSFKG